MLTGTCVPEQKSQYLRQFKAGRTQILVSTIIAEVGLDNSNATVMVIEGADRFGLSSLHQLRGRVCRSTDTAFCFLVSETSNPTSIARLEVIEKCNCGFTIAEEDLRLRGAGEVFSTRQTGLPALRWCSVVDDYDLMIEAKEIVNAGSVGSGVVEMVRLKYGESLELGGVV
jgi:ATP-dependent DNA helicase RecG